MFVFTHTRGSHNQPVSTLGPVQTILLQISAHISPNIITYNPKNTFCVDSESFNCLMALNKNLNCHNNLVKLYSESWRISLRTCKEMLKFVEERKPHKLLETMCINDARKMIYALSQPITSISGVIADLIYDLNEQEVEINSTKKQKRLWKASCLCHIGILCQLHSIIHEQSAEFVANTLTISGTVHRSVMTLVI